MATRPYRLLAHSFATPAYRTHVPTGIPSYPRHSGPRKTIGDRPTPKLRLPLRLFPAQTKSHLRRLICGYEQLKRPNRQNKVDPDARLRAAEPVGHLRPRRLVPFHRQRDWAEERNWRPHSWISKRQV